MIAERAAARDALERRLAALRAARIARSGIPTDGPAASDRRSPAGGEGPSPAIALAAALGGSCVATAAGTYVRVVGPVTTIPVDRFALASLPGLPPPDVPLVCLDTETTGLATAAGTVAFLVGFGTWRDDRFEQVQLLLPDHPDEPALLDAIRALIPPDAWLVTYNGRSFDWPLLVARYRLARRGPPEHGGHLDLLSFVRRIFRHRLADARLRTVERELLGLERHDDVEGWEIPARYLSFLRDGSAGPLASVVRHNDADVRSLARLLASIAGGLGDPRGRRGAHPDDLSALAAACSRAGRLEAALDCLDAALASPQLAALRAGGGAGPELAGRRADRVRRDAIAGARARTLRRLGRHDEALAAWRDIAVAGGPFAAIAWLEIAKALEHRRRDPDGALAASQRALAIAQRSRLLGRPLPRLEDDLTHRLRRLRRRLARRAARRACQDGWTGWSSGEATG